MAKKVFVFDVKKCSGCYCCQIACKDEHCDTDWMPYAKPQPVWGQFWLRQNLVECGQAPQVRTYYYPILCMHCDDAPCIPVCPVDAISKRDDGLVWIDPKKCNGCTLCIGACPYGVIFFNQGSKQAQKCTGCAHLVDRGWVETRCVNACTIEALQFGNESDFSTVIAESEVLKPELNLKPRVYYKNLPKRFIAGTVYDPAVDEVVEGATCTLTGASSSQATTDLFGDFWLEGLPVGTFSLTISGNGKTKTIPGINTDKDVGLGDIALA